MRTIHDPASELEIRAQEMREEAQAHRKEAANRQSYANELTSKADRLEAAAADYDQTVQKLRGSTTTPPSNLDGLFEAIFGGKAEGCNEPDCPACGDPEASIKAMLAARYGIDPAKIVLVRS